MFAICNSFGCVGGCSHVGRVIRAVLRGFAGHANGLGRPPEAAHDLSEKVERCVRHTATGLAAYAPDRNLILPMTGADDGVVAVTARARLWQRNEEASKVRHLRPRLLSWRNWRKMSA